MLQKNIKILTTLALFIASVILFSAFKSSHEYYVSVTKVEHVKAQNSIQIISQIFIDDFEKVIRERYDESITLAVNNESEKVDTYMEKYLKAKLNIKVNTADVSFNFLGKEYKDDIAYCYIEIENISGIKTIEIKNEILFDVFPDQQNILRTKINGKNKSFILIPDNDTAVLNFD